jgi:malate dehydrogenase
MFPCSVLLEGEFGLNDLCVGIPVILGKNGIEKIVEIKLDEAELSQLQESAVGVKATNTLLNDLNL